MPGVFGFRTLDDMRADDRAGPRARERAAVIGGGLLGLEAARGLLDPRARGRRRAPRRAPDEPAARRRAGGAILHRAMTRHGHPRAPGADRRRRCSATGAYRAALRRRLRARLRHGGHLGRHPAQRRARARSPGCPSSAAIVVDDHMRVGRRGRHLRRRRVRPAPRAGLRAGRAAVGAGDGAGRSPHRAQPARRLPRLQARDQAQGHRASSWRRWAGRARATPTTRSCSSPSRGAACTRSSSSATASSSARSLLGDLGKVSFLCRRSTAARVLPEERGLAAVRPGGAAGAGRASASCPTTRRSATATASARATIRACVAGGARTLRAVMDATRAGTGCGSCKAQVQELLEWAAGGAVEDDPAADYYVPGIPLDQARADRGGPRARAALRLGRVRRVCRRAARTRRASRRWRRCCGWCGRASTRTSATRASSTTAFTRTSRSDGTFSVVPRISGGVTTRRPAAPDRRRRGQVRGADGQDHRRPADRPARRQEGGPAGGLAGPRHAVRLRLRQGFRTVKTCVGLGVLPLRPRRQHDARHRRSSSASRASRARPR